jgi:predicted nucleic acid-binding protein
VILLDTNVLVALCDGRDPHHSHVTEDIARFGTQPLLLTSLVLTETGHFLQHRSQRARLREVLQRFKIQPYPVTDDGQLWDQVFQWVMKYADQSPDFVDAFLVILSHRDRKVKIWTYDSEFWTIWRRPDGSAVPLAARVRR